MSDVVIIDLETGSMSPNCVIFTIGAVRFAPDSPTPPTIEELRKNGLYMYVEVTQQATAGRITDSSTVDVWWPNQSLKAQEEKNKAYGKDAVGLDIALAALADYVREDDRVYARGQEFERDILMNAYKMVNKRFFRKFNRIFDVRTWIEAFTGSNTGMYHIAGIEHLTTHVAIDDCIRDALEMYHSRKEFITNVVADPKHVELLPQGMEFLTKVSKKHHNHKSVMETSDLTRRGAYRLHF